MRFAAAFVSCAVATAVSPPAQQWVQGYSFGTSESHPHAGIETADGGFVLVGDGVDYNAPKPAVHRQLMAMKTDAKGNMLWQLRVGDCGFNYGKWVAELDDGTLVIAGAVSDCSGGGATADDDGAAHALTRALVRVGADGTLLHTQTFANAGADQGLRDGLMSVALATGEPNTIVATGWVRGESAGTGYVDEPMFLIAGGSAVLMKLTFEPAVRNGTALAAGKPKDMAVVFANELDTSAEAFVAWQGMRLAIDAPRQRYIVSAAVRLSADPDARRQFGLFATDRAGKQQWARAYAAADGPTGGHASHPYALTALAVPSAPGAGAARNASTAAVYAIGGLAVLYDSKGVEQCEGRALGVGSDGAIVYDARFRQDDADENTECYGIVPAADGGAVLTCGAGVEPELHPHDSQKQKTWRVLLHGVAPDGGAAWQALYSDNARLQNDAGENLIRTRDGGIAVLIDSQTWGPSSTGGNFALMKLAAEQ
eukprot:g1095.t1